MVNKPVNLYRLNVLSMVWRGDFEIWSRFSYHARHLTKVQNHEERREISVMLPQILGDRGGLVAITRLLGRRVLSSKSDFTEDPPCMGPVAR
ncbi:hypothetical protein AVEN_236966-1 [Araneus ventricosus]|uniref:Uncharacterized protein n=1 Tax=Araneus ventricosus TaxID=182803 RepID=A0A4Y2RRE6_ARAVE|nr:hypothetical protein AVEN_236966-1 [Araneus ventricosus]